jgi:hypothetical protein
MHNQELIETLISSGQFTEISFSLSYLDKFSDDEISKNEVHEQITEIKKASGIICDNLRSSNLANYENFRKLLNKDYSFSDDKIIKELYNYGMFASK